MDKKSYDKIKSITKSHEDLMQEQLRDEEMQILWLREALKEYANDGNYEKFYRSVSYVIKSRATISQFAQDTELNRGNLSEILSGKIEPKLKTMFKILDELGYELTLNKKSA